MLPYLTPIEIVQLAVTPDEPHVVGELSVLEKEGRRRRGGRGGDGTEREND